MKKLFAFFAVALTAISASATFYSFNGTELTQGMTLVDDEYVEVRVGNLPSGLTSSVLQIADLDAFYTPVNCMLEPSERTNPTRTLTLCDHQFEYAANVRSNAAPTEDNPEGAVISRADVMGRGEINNITIVAEPNTTCQITIIYVREKNKSFDCMDTEYEIPTYAFKDSLLHTETFTNCEDDDITYEYHMSTYQLKSGRSYTFYSLGATTQVLGFETAKFAPAPVEIKSLAATIDEEGIHVTVSDESMQWIYNLPKASQYADSAAIDAYLVNLFEERNDFFGDVAYNMINTLGVAGFTHGSQDLLFTDASITPYLLKDEEMYFYAIGIASSDGYIVRASNLAVVKFTHGTTTAVENVAAEMKTAKTIENGQMIIIREGKRYNAVGAEL